MCITNIYIYRYRYIACNFSPQIFFGGKNRLIPASNLLFTLSSCTEKLILIVVISFDVTFPQAISANGWRVSLPEEGKAADDDNYKDCWLFPFLFLFKKWYLGLSGHFLKLTRYCHCVEVAQPVD